MHTLGCHSAVRTNHKSQQLLSSGSITAWNVLFDEAEKLLF